MLPTGRATRQGSRKGSRTWWGDTDVTQEAVPRAVDLNTHAAQTERVAARHRERHQQCIQEVCAVAREREENQRANQRDTEWRAQQEQFRTREHIRALESQLGFIDDLSSQDGAALSLSGLDSREQARVGALEARLGFCVLSFSQEEGRLYHDEEEDIVYHLKAELKEHKRRLMKEQRVSDELLRRLQQQSEARKSEEFIAARFADAKPPSQAHLPAPKGEQDIAALISSMSASGRPHYRQLEACWVPGTLAKVHLGSINILACECTRLLATHALSPGQDWMKIGKLLGQGGFGSVHQGYSEQTGRTYAVKTAKPGVGPKGMIREALAYCIVKPHPNILGCYCMNDIPESTGLVFELGISDLFDISTRQRRTKFSFDQIIGFLADGAQGLQHFNEHGICVNDFKQDNIIVCHANNPSGFIGKLADPGLWCGVTEWKVKRTGTTGRVPPENFEEGIEAAVTQDVFTVGAEACYMLARPEIKWETANMFAHSCVMTSEEVSLRSLLPRSGAATREFLERVTMRTMSDGSFAKKFFRRQNLNELLPSDMLPEICKELAAAVAPEPEDRPQEVAVVTQFLRRLQLRMAQHQVSQDPVNLSAMVEEPQIIGTATGSGGGGGGVFGVSEREVVGKNNPEEDIFPMDDSDSGEAMLRLAEALAGGSGDSRVYEEQRKEQGQVGDGGGGGVRGGGGCCGGGCGSDVMDSSSAAQAVIDALDAMPNSFDESMPDASGATPDVNATAAVVAAAAAATALSEVREGGKYGGTGNENVVPGLPSSMCTIDVDTLFAPAPPINVLGSTESMPSLEDLSWGEGSSPIADVGRLGREISGRGGGTIPTLARLREGGGIASRRTRDGGGSTGSDTRGTQSDGGGNTSGRGGGDTGDDGGGSTGGSIVATRGDGGNHGGDLNGGSDAGSEARTPTSGTSSMSNERERWGLVRGLASKTIASWFSPVGHG